VSFVLIILTCPAGVISVHVCYIPYYRVIEDDIDESESEIALVVVKDGEKISLVRFLPQNIQTHSSTIGTSGHGVTKVENESKYGVKLCDRQRTLDNKQTYQKMEMIRSRLNQRKKNLAQLPPLIQRMKSYKVIQSPTRTGMFLEISDQKFGIKNEILKVVF